MPQLTSTNYSAWSRSFLLTLSIRSKTSFIDGSIPYPAATDPLYSAWVSCNNLLVAWHLKSISEPIASTLFYFSSATQIWDVLKRQFSQLDDGESVICNSSCALFLKILVMWMFILMNWTLCGKNWNHTDLCLIVLVVVARWIVLRSLLPHNKRTMFSNFLMDWMSLMPLWGHRLSWCILFLAWMRRIT